MTTLGLNQRIGANIRNARLNAGVSQAELAKAIGVGQSAISLIENGQRGISPQQVVKIGEVIGVTPNGIFGVEGEFSGFVLSEIAALLKENEQAGESILAYAKGITSARHIGMES